MSDQDFYFDADLESRASAVLNDNGIDLKFAILDYLNRIVYDDSRQITSELKNRFKEYSNGGIKKRKVLTLNDLPTEERERRLKIINTEGPLSEAYGVLEGMVWMADDFDEPLECMKEYNIN